MSSLWSLSVEMSRIQLWSSSTVYGQCWSWWRFLRHVMSWDGSWSVKVEGWRLISWYEIEWVPYDTKVRNQWRFSLVSEGWSWWRKELVDEGSWDMYEFNEFAGEVLKLVSEGWVSQFPIQFNEFLHDTKTRNQFWKLEVYQFGHVLHIIVLVQSFPVQRSRLVFCILMSLIWLMRFRMRFVVVL